MRKKRKKRKKSPPPTFIRFIRFIRTAHTLNPQPHVEPSHQQKDTNTMNLNATGNLTRDIELRYAASGTALASFGLAVNRRKKVGDQYEDETSYLKCVAFGSLAENLAQSADKGSRVIVAGYLKQNDWTDKDGNERHELELVVNDAGLELRFDPAEHARTERTTHRDRAAAAADPEPF